MSAPLWPALIQFAGQAELSFVRDQLQWDKEIQLHTNRRHPEDRLIDSDGFIFSLTSNPMQTSGDKISLHNLIHLIRAHAAQCGECCVSKFSANSIQEAIQSLIAMEQP